MSEGNDLNVKIGSILMMPNVTNYTFSLTVLIIEEYFTEIDKKSKGVLEQRDGKQECYKMERWKDRELSHFMCTKVGNFTHI